ncbi:hypothetical protein TrVE_jg13603 [Triparma verrucosa]|uniref:Uncharacterized protein n=2 Tax=Triparma TaxID=722752 RepID=A0A9W7BZU8_9STRA|nr:hypothetical protein TrVE_jg13603 [Triparma verrucosa]GMH96697.1 hypothetical protein TrST_g5293 [Triparma strigata]
MIKLCKALEAIAILEAENDDEPDLSQSIAETTNPINGFLLYDSFLSNQRFYDDLKHVNYPGLSYTYPKNMFLNNEEITLCVSQDKSLGKGGMLWDAAFILSEYVLSAPGLLLPSSAIIELGAGCGLVGALLNKLNLNCVTTDLEAHLPLLTSNFERNGLSAESVRALDWSNFDELHFSKYDVVLGADIVASLYDPELLAKTIHDVIKPTGRGCICYKSREDQYHERFELSMKQLFESFAAEILPLSRNKNEKVKVIRFSRKKIII